MTVRVTAAVWVRPPPVPVTVIGYVPGAAVPATVRVITEEPEPGAAIGLTLKDAVTPVGSPEAERVIAELKLSFAAVVIVEVPEFP